MVDPVIEQLDFYLVLLSGDDSAGSPHPAGREEKVQATGGSRGVQKSPVVGLVARCTVP